MSNGTARESRKGSARLPLALNLLIIVGVAGLVLWFTLAPPPPPPPAPAVQISLAPPAAEPPAAAKPHADAPAAPAAAPTPPAADAAPPGHAPAPPVPAAPKPSPVETAPAAPPPHPDPAPPRPEKLPPVETGPALSKAPAAGLIEPSPQGPLPIVGRDGREVWQVYARPFDKDDKRPRIAVVLYGLGMNAAATRSAIRKLPGAVSLAFTPYANGLDGWIPQARAAGHEALMMVPMEPNDFPISDPGPRALLTSLSAARNIDRLEWVLARAAGYVGVTEYLGSRFTASSHHMQTLFEALRKRGLLFLAGGRRSAGLMTKIAASLRLPLAVSTLYIDRRVMRDPIDAQLAELERLANNSGHAIGMGFPYPITIKRLALWSAKLNDRGFVLAPVSALATRSGP